MQVRRGQALIKTSRYFQILAEKAEKAERGFVDNKEVLLSYIHV